MKPYESLTFTDSFMFGKIMEDKEIVRSLLECLLQRSIGELSEVQVERGIQYTVDGKPVRLDVYAKDDSAIYDMEMQNLNKQPLKKLELAKRSRFYHATIDNDSLDKGIPYSLLPESNVIFICTFDPFGLNLPVYTFEKICVECESLCLGDGAVTYFFNTAYDVDSDRYGLAEGIRHMFTYIQTGSVMDTLTGQISLAVDKCRKNAIWRSDYMRELSLFMELKEEGREEGIKQGIEQGVTQGRDEGANILASVIKRLKDGMSDDQLHEAGFDDKYIELAKSLM